jgi:hypothetical protein
MSMSLFRLVLMIVALVCFALVAVGVNPPRPNLLAVGLFCWALAATLAQTAGR